MLRRKPQKLVSADRLPFCPICGLWPHLCVCTEFPTVDTSCEFLVIQHFSEARRQSNSGRLVARLLTGSRVVPWGWPGQRFDPAVLSEAASEQRVLFPSADARELDPGLDRPPSGGRRIFVLLDGTWSQAKSMARRVPGLRPLSFVTLPPGPAPTWVLRRAPDKGSYSTLETAIRAIEVLDGDEVARPVRQAMETVMQRSLYMRGKIRRRDLNL